MKVLIKYKIFVPGFFKANEYDGSEIVEVHGDQSIADAVAKDYENQKLEAKIKGAAVTLVDYRVME